VPVRRKAAIACFALAAGAAVLALVALVTGGFRVHIFGIPISARGEHRAALFALIFATAGFGLFDHDRRLLRAGGRGARRGVMLTAAWTVARAPLLLRLAAAAAAAIVLAAGIRYGVTSAGGSDPSGYLNAAWQWRHGELVTHQELARGATWPDADGTFTPLAYRARPDHAIVPVVSPGLPLLMAGADAVFGSCGPFRVGPACAALLVWLTFLLGARVFGRPVGTMAAIAVATSPTVLFMSMSAMSDVPAAAFWTAAMVLACRRTPLSAAAAGAAAGIAIMIRANLAPLAVFPGVVCLWPGDAGDRRGSVLRALAFAAACAPFAIAVAWLFNVWYGSPLSSGYGRSSGLFAVRNFWPNVTRYPRWLWDTQGPVPFLFLAAPWLTARRAPSRLPALLFAYVLAVFACYVFYEPFDAWWYLRFLLPAFPIFFVLAFASVWRAGEMLGAGRQRLIAVVVVSAVAYQGIHQTRQFGLVHLAEGEQKYADAARFAATHLPANAVVLAMQHSGSVRLYAGRAILRYDLLDRDWLDRALEFVSAKGFEPYLLGEEWEVEIFRDRFARQRAAVAVSGRPLAELPAHKVWIYHLDGTVNSRPPAVIPATSGCSTR
jgi:hypothetical protein